jgi:tyrosinase
METEMERAMTPQAPPHVRRNVWTLPSDDQTIEEYAKAVGIMKARNSNDPTSWSYQAAMHGTHAATSKPLWNGCQHGTWFFVAWHRMFIYYFEEIVRAAVVQAGGSSDWALPFWDYGAGGEQATLPFAFRNPVANGGANPLYVSQRAQGINGGLALPAPVASPAHALSRPSFTGTVQFGGGITPVQQFSGSTRRLEQTPHNDVHNAVGGPSGWMADLDHAAEDPIFWLHHSNIDRIWFVWNSPTHKDPGDHRWNGQQFSFFDQHGNQVHKTCSDVRDIVNQLGYTYEAVRAPAAESVAPAPKREEQETAMMTPSDSGEEERAPELVGASDAPVQLIGGPAQVSLQIDARAAAAVLADGGFEEPTHIYLLLDSSVADDIVMWTLMVVAMMLPAALPAVRHVGANSLRWRRRRAMATFVAVYVSIWVAFGVLLLAVSRVWSSLDGAALLPLALALSAGWQLTVHKRRALRDCHRPLPLPPRGRRATVGVIRFALFNGLACLRSCWAMMFAMGVASSAMVFWMIAITGIVTTEKLAQKPRQATRAGSALLAGGALLVGASSLIG